MMGEKRQKIWGKTERILSIPGHVADWLDILPGGFCSEHRHARMANLFICKFGEVEIDIWDQSGEKQSYNLHADEEQVFLVLPGIWHQFRSKTGAIVIELCFIAADHREFDGESDIQRRKEGGRE